ncbi:MAG: hypothetical protein QW096_09415 [Thermofilaceae archaeon]
MKPILVAAILAVFLAPLLVLSATTFEALELSQNSSIIVDGDPSDWGYYTCTEYNTYTYTTIAGVQQWIWCDSFGDERTDFASPDKRVDLIQFRITGDTDNLYLLFIFNDMSEFNIGNDGGAFIALTINRNGEGSGAWFAGDSDTEVDEDARWLYQIVVNLADSRFRGQGLRSLITSLTNNWGGVFYIVNDGWAFQSDSAVIGVNLDNRAVEVRIPWSMIGGAPSSESFFLRLSLITARGWSNYEENEGGTWDIGGFGTSDALDAMTTTGPNTWDEVEDGVVDYYVDVYFTTEPPYVPIPEPWVVSLVVGAVASVSVGLGIYLKRVKVE